MASETTIDHPGPVGPYVLDIDFSKLSLETSSDFNVAGEPMDIDERQKYTEPALKWENEDETNLDREKTIKTLSHYFGLHVTLPEDRLCPPVPNRFYYIRIMQRLVDETTPDFSGAYDSERVVLGIDIGTGSSCIYPLLGCANRPKWNFVATELDQTNFDAATKNVVDNGLEQRIQVVKTANANSPLLPSSYLATGRADFVMCNPPFYCSRDERQALRAMKTTSPHAAYDGADVEMVCEGGDLGFAEKILEESFALRDRVQWFSCMMGKLQSAKTFVEHLKQRGVTNWYTVLLRPGRFTVRWVIAWSYQDLRPLKTLFDEEGVAEELRPERDVYYAVPKISDDSDISRALVQELGSFWANFEWDEASLCGLFWAIRNTWSRSFRRRINRQGPRGDELSVTKANAALVVRVSIEMVDGKEGQEKKKMVVVRRIKGNDPDMWETITMVVHRCMRLI